MPRTARLDIPGQLYHVTARGVERCDIFRDDIYRASFCDRLCALLLETDSACFAWALMSNHFHLLLRPGAPGLAAIMRRLLTGHAVAFNRRHLRAGHLFQNRYYSILCDADSYLLPLVRYIHLNPLKAGIVSNLLELDSYPWCGHAVLLGNDSLAGQAVDELLGLFARTDKVARRKYSKFIEDGLEGQERQAEDFSISRLRDCLNISADECADGRVLGGKMFVETVLPETATVAAARIDFATLVQRISEMFGVSVEDLRSRRRTRPLADARALLCALAIENLQYTGAQLADYLKQARSSISRAEQRGRKLLTKQPNLRERLLDS